MTRAVRWIYVAGLAAACAAPPASETGLESWNDGEAVARIRAFVETVTDPDSPDYVRPAERIAVFDNDGTLWSEKPAYFQLMFAIERVGELAPEHPDWKDREPFKSAIAGDLEGIAQLGELGLITLVMATHTGLSTEEFDAAVAEWIGTARHPRFDRPFTELAYAPMLELLEYLRAHEFKTWIVSGGGVDFLRVWAERVYGIPPEQVVGSTLDVALEVRDGVLELVRKPQIDHVNDKAGKPVGIRRAIGRRPIAAFGNSDGDLQMLQWTAARDGASLALLVHHTDGEREWAYDRSSEVGKLDAALDEARARGWVVVDMARDWRRVYAFEGEPADAALR